MEERRYIPDTKSFLHCNETRPPTAHVILEVHISQCIFQQDLCNEAKFKEYKSVPWVEKF